jgi:hypothetical protein
MFEIAKNQKRIVDAQGYDELWKLIKENVKGVLKKERVGMMLFLDDLPLRLGAYHPLGTNNIVLNRALVQIVEATTKSRKVLNAFIYTLLLHEYLHTLGYTQESEVRSLVYEISKACFGDEHVTTQLAKLGPWSLLKDLALDVVGAPKRLIEIVRNFEEANRGYIV